MREMYESMLAIKDPYVWGEYAFSRDILKDRIKKDQKKEMIEQAIACGEYYARQIRLEYAGRSIEEIYESLSIRLCYSEESIIGEQILFAQFTPPDEVVIMKEPLKKYETMLKQKNLTDTLPSMQQIRDLLLGHELFHWIEEKDEKSIYTRNKKISLWKIWKFENQSTIRALGELAAMYFTQQFNQTEYSPFLIDVLLSYSYHKKIACSIYDDIATIAGIKKDKEIL